MSAAHPALTPIDTKVQNNLFYSALFTEAPQLSYTSFSPLSFVTEDLFTLYCFSS